MIPTLLCGSGKPRREFLHVNDLAEALIHLVAIDNPPDVVNVGTGTDISIRELSELVAEIVGYQGNIQQDSTKPDGTPVKRVDPSVINGLGWSAKTNLRNGIQQTYQDFLKESANGQLTAK